MELNVRRACVFLGGLVVLFVILFFVWPAWVFYERPLTILLSTPQPAVTPTLIPEPTLEPTATLESTATATLTFTPTPTQTPTLVPIPTDQPTLTSTPTLRPTFTPTLTSTSSPTPTRTPTIANTPVNPLTGVITAFYVEHNAERALRGFAPLQRNSSLELIAQARAQVMALSDVMSHTAPNGENAFDLMDKANYYYTRAAENIGYSTSFANYVPTLMRAWINSPGHFTNMMNPNLESLGIGVARSPVSGRYYVAAVFATP